MHFVQKFVLQYESISVLSDVPSNVLYCKPGILDKFFKFSSGVF